MRRWLVLYALSITSVVILAFLIPLAILVRDLSADRALNAAEREAQAIARFVATTEEDAVAALRSSLDGLAGVSVALPSGTVIGIDLPTEFDLTSARSQAQAHRQRLENGEAIVVPVVRGTDSVWVVVVAVPDSDLTENVGTAWVVLGVLGVSLMLVALVAADRIGRAVSRPVNELAAATHRLGQGDLDVNVLPAGPRELEEVGAAFNTLTGRVATLMDQERETAADLAHRLRTPLTALRLDVEALGRETDVSKLVRDVDELERVISHIISEARRPLRDDASVQCDLIEVVMERADFWGSLADEQDRTWKVDAPSSAVPIAASCDEISAVLDAIVGNVFAHTPSGTEYSMTVESMDESSVRLTVSDRGPGIGSPAMLQRGASGGTSTGLGIDIVRSFAHRVGGRAEWLAEPTGGTSVQLVLPRSSTPPRA